MIQLPEDWLISQFDGCLTRGSIIRFKPEDLQYRKFQGQPKFAVVLNASLPAPEIHYIFSTSQTAFYDKHAQFEPAIIRVPANTYDCFPLDTIFPFSEVFSIPVEKLHKQYVDGHLEFCGTLNTEHLERMNAIIKIGLFIAPRLRSYLTV